MQPTFVAKEWVDHTLGQAREPECKLEITEKAYEEADKKLKQTLSQLTEVEKFRKNTKAALVVHEKQVAESLKAQKKAKNQLALNMVKVKQQQKQLEVKDAEKAKAKQAAYDLSMTKTTQNLTAQLKDVAQAFCLEIWGQALTAAGVSTKSELRAPDRVYYPPALCLAPSLS